MTRIHTPLVIQMEAVECGAACLGIILGYYGKYVPLEELRMTCGVSRDGSSAVRVISAAESYGMVADGHSLGIDELEEHPKPSILFWEFKHFVVYEGRDEENFYINDPAVGPRKISFEEFDRGFTGVALVICPGPDFKPGGTVPSFFQTLQKRLTHVSKVMVFLLAIQLFIAFLNLLFPALTRAFVDQIVMKHYLEWKWWFMGAMLLLTGFMATFSALQLLLLYRSNVKLTTEYSADFIQHLFHLPLHFFQQRYSGEVAYRFNLNEKVSDTMTGPFFRVTADILLALIFGIAMFFYDPLIAFCAIVALFLIFAVLKYYQKERLAIYAGYKQHLGKNIGYAIGALESIETLKATGLEGRVFAKWTALYTKAQNDLQSIIRQDAWTAASARFFQLIAFTLLLGIGSWHVMTGKLTPGGMIAMQMLLLNFLTPAMNLIEIYQELQLFKVDLSRLDDIMNYPIDRWYESKSGDPDVKILGAIQVRDLSFGYSRFDPPFLKEISFTAKPGACIAIVGPTGCGKTTLIRTLSGLIAPWSGEILIDGKQIQDIPKELLTQNIFFLEQTNFLFQDTLKNNITLFDPNIPEEALQEALNDACLQDLLDKNLGNVNVYLEEMGANLSGGERQRVEIARALLRYPRILLVDESMNALDYETEERIIKNIRQRGCTLILVSHRLSALSLCDEILVMDQGKIIQRGTLKELADQPGLYQKLAI